MKAATQQQLLQSNKVPREVEVGVEWRVTYTTLTQKTGVCIPRETKPNQTFVPKLNRSNLYLVHLDEARSGRAFAFRTQTLKGRKVFIDW